MELDLFFPIAFVVFFGLIWAFPGGSDDKECACNSGDPCSVPGLGRSPGEVNGSPLQYSWRRIPWIEQPQELQSMGLQRFRHDWVTNTWPHIKRMPLFPLFASKLTYSKDLKEADTRKKKRRESGKCLDSENGVQRNEAARDPCIMWSESLSFWLSIGFQFCYCVILNTLLNLRKLLFMDFGRSKRTLPPWALVKTQRRSWGLNPWPKQVYWRKNRKRTSRETCAKPREVLAPEWWGGGGVGEVVKVVAFTYSFRWV